MRVSSKGERSVYEIIGIKRRKRRRKNREEGKGEGFSYWLINFWSFKVIRFIPGWFWRIS